MADLEDNTEDPFSAKNAPGVSLIVQMRIYDVLLGIYTELNEPAASALINAHEKGLVLGPLPVIDIENSGQPTDE